MIGLGSIASSKGAAIDPLKDFKSFEDIVKIDIEDNPINNNFTSIYGANIINSQTNKAKIKVELDWLTEIKKNEINSILNNRSTPLKFYIDYPNDSAQVIVPETSNFYTGFFEIDDFNTITLGIPFTMPDDNFWVTPSFSPDNITKYFSGIAVQFDLSDYINNFGIEYIKRLTLFAQNFGSYFKNILPQIPIESPSNDIQIDVLNTGINAYEKIGYESYTPNRYIYSDYSTSSLITQKAYSVRARDTFTTFEDYIDSNNKVTFRLINKTRRSVGETLITYAQYLNLFINGYACNVEKGNNFTYRSTFTEQGYVGTLDLAEL